MCPWKTMFDLNHTCEWFRRPSDVLLNPYGWRWRSCASLKGDAGLEKWPWMVAEAGLDGGILEGQPQDCRRQGGEEWLLHTTGRLQWQPHQNTCELQVKFIPPFQARREGSIIPKRLIKMKKLKTGIFLCSGLQPSLLTKTTHTDTAWAGEAERLWALSHLSRCHPSASVSMFRVAMESKFDFEGKLTAKSAHPCSLTERAGVVWAQSTLDDACQLLGYQPRCSALPWLTRRVPYLTGEEQNLEYW